MAAVITRSVVESERSAPLQYSLHESFRNDPAPQEKQPGASLAGSILRGTILVTFGAGALILLLFALVPPVFVALLLFLPILVPVILLGSAIVFMEDLQPVGTAEAGRVPCTCHRDHAHV